MLRFLLPLVLCCAATTRLTAADDLGVRVPEGFEVSLYADDTLAHDIYSMTIDAQGRVVVAGRTTSRRCTTTMATAAPTAPRCYSAARQRGPRHVLRRARSDLHRRQLGHAAARSRRRRCGRRRARDLDPAATSRTRRQRHRARARRMLLRDLRQRRRRLRASTPPLPTSPVKHPRSGAVVRFSADGQPLDVFAHGFRNPYDLDFDAQGTCSRSTPTASAIITCPGTLPRDCSTWPRAWSTAGC